MAQWFFYYSTFFRDVLICEFSKAMQEVKCPNCGRQTEYHGNEFRPFCSERCKLIDFGEWADGKYALPSQTSTLSEEDIREIEKGLAEKEEID